MVTQVRTKEMIAHYLEGALKYEGLTQESLHRQMRQTLYECLSDGRDYVVRIGKPWRWHEDMEPYPGIVTYQLDALVLLDRVGQAKVGEYVTLRNCDAGPASNREHVFHLRDDGHLVTVSVRSQQIMWHGKREWVWEVVEWC